VFIYPINLKLQPVNLYIMTGIYTVSQDSHWSGEVESVYTTFGKFIQDTVHQMLSKSAEICIRYDKNILAYFFLGHDVYFYGCFCV